MHDDFTCEPRMMANPMAQDELDQLLWGEQHLFAQGTTLPTTVSRPLNEFSRDRGRKTESAIRLKKPFIPARTLGGLRLAGGSVGPEPKDRGCGTEATRANEQPGHRYFGRNRSSVEQIDRLADKTISATVTSEAHTTMPGRPAHV